MEEENTITGMHDLPFDVLLHCVECSLSPEIIFAIACLCHATRDAIRPVIEYYFKETHWDRQSLELNNGHRRLLSYPACRVTRLRLDCLSAYKPHPSDIVLERLTDLQTLEARRFYFTDERFLHLTNLTSIDVAGNMGFLVSTLGHLTRLTTLNMSNQQTRRHCPIVSLPPSLTWLDISGTKQPFWPSMLDTAPLHNLVYLDARQSNAITDGALQRMTSLRTLSLCHSSECSAIVKTLLTFTQLQSLSLVRWRPYHWRLIRDEMPWLQVLDLIK